MSLIALIADFRLLENQLRFHLETQSDARERVSLLRQCADCLDRIERYVPRDAVEARDQVYFFLSRAMENSDTHIGHRDVDLALTLSARLFDMGELAAAPLPFEKNISSGGLVDYVVQSPERVSLIGHDYTYVATSEANAAYYGSRPVRIIGEHVGALIGSPRFEQRAKGRLDKCLSGISQEYLHQIETPAGNRTMSCQMKPVRLARHGVDAALVYMRDITEDLASFLAEPRIPGMTEADA